MSERGLRRGRRGRRPRKVHLVGPAPAGARGVAARSGSRAPARARRGSPLALRGLVHVALVCEAPAPRADEDVARWRDGA